MTGTAYADPMTGLHRKRKRPTGDGEYTAMLTRMHRGYEKRLGTNPTANLPRLRDLEQSLTDAANVGIYTANKIGGHSINELADIFGVSKQAIFKRVQAGELVARQRDQAQRRSISQERTAAAKQLASGSTGD